MDALGAAVLDLRRLAWDLSLFTTAEFGFVTLPPQYTTGSSIMPNKRNPDLVELMRATYASIAASRTELEQLLSLPTGYHRDLQFTKGALYHAFGRGLGALGLLPNLLRGMAWNTDRLAKAFDDGMYATDKAVELAVAGMPFREAYRLAAVEPLPKAGADAQASLDARVSPGGAGALGLETLKQRLGGNHGPGLRRVSPCRRLLRTVDGRGDEGGASPRTPAANPGKQSRKPCHGPG